MSPVLFRVPWINWDIPGYGFMLMVGFLVSVIWAVRRAVRSRANPDVILNCAFIALVGGIIGSRFMFVVHYWPQFAARGNWADVLWAIVDVRKGGLEVYGGFILAMAGIVAYLKLGGYPLRWYLDIMAPSGALGIAFGRIGCLLNGCCWGLPSDVPWAIRFPFASNAAAEHWYAGVPGAELPRELIFVPPGGVGLDGRAAYPLTYELFRVSEKEVAAAAAARKELEQKAAPLRERLAQARTDAEKAAARRELDGLYRQFARRIRYTDVLGGLSASGLTLPQLQALARQYPSQPVHPVQPYGTVTMVLLALALNSLFYRRTRDGQVICALLVLESLARFTLEFLRADNPADTLGLTISQFLALLLMGVGLLGLLGLRFLPPRSPGAAPWEPPPEPATNKPAQVRPAGAAPRK